MCIEIIKENNLKRLALVGPNSQGKSHLLSTSIKPINKKTIYVTNEVKADENLKNSTDTSTLISWLNSLLDNTNTKNAIQEEIEKIDLSKLNKDSFLNIELTNNLDSYKGIIGAEIKTDSNKWRKPGSGEKFLGQLLLISKILEDNHANAYEYLVIDEPEQHLHPSLFIKVGKILNKISNQGIIVIIATHSPEIVQSFIEDTCEIGKVINGELTMIPNKTELMNTSLEYECYKDDKLSFKEYLNIKTKYDLYFENFIIPLIIKSLFYGKVVLGEGAIESKLFEIHQLDYSSALDKNNIGYFITDGKIFIPIFLTILKTLGIKTVTLLDLDTEKETKHEYLNKTINELSDEVISFKCNIELKLGLIDEDKPKDKYISTIITLNEYYLNNDVRLQSILDNINEKLEKL